MINVTQITNLVTDWLGLKTTDGEESTAASAALQEASRQMLSDKAYDYAAVFSQLGLAQADILSIVNNKITVRVSDVVYTLNNKLELLGDYKIETLINDANRALSGEDVQLPEKAQLLLDQADAYLSEAVIMQSLGSCQSLSDLSAVAAHWIDSGMSIPNHVEEALQIIKTGVAGNDLTSVIALLTKDDNNLPETDEEFTTLAKDATSASWFAVGVKGLSQVGIKLGKGLLAGIGSLLAVGWAVNKAAFKFYFSIPDLITDLMVKVNDTSNMSWDDSRTSVFPRAVICMRYSVAEISRVTGKNVASTRIWLKTLPGRMLRCGNLLFDCSFNSDDDKMQVDVYCTTQFVTPYIYSYAITSIGNTGNTLMTATIPWRDGCSTPGRVQSYVIPPELGTKTASIRMLALSMFRTLDAITETGYCQKYNIDPTSKIAGLGTQVATNSSIYQELLSKVSLMAISKTPDSSDLFRVPTIMDLTPYENVVSEVHQQYLHYTNWNYKDANLTPLTVPAWTPSEEVALFMGSVVTGVAEMDGVDDIWTLGLMTMLSCVTDARDAEFVITDVARSHIQPLLPSTSELSGDFGEVSRYYSIIDVINTDDMTSYVLSTAAKTLAAVAAVAILLFGAIKILPSAVSFLRRRRQKQTLNSAKIQSAKSADNTSLIIKLISGI